MQLEKLGNGQVYFSLVEAEIVNELIDDINGETDPEKEQKSLMKLKEFIDSVEIEDNIDTISILEELGYDNDV